jgi:hypothetical protein
MVRARLLGERFGMQRRTTGCVICPCSSLQYHRVQQGLLQGSS